MPRFWPLNQYFCRLLVMRGFLNIIGVAFFMKNISQNWFLNPPYWWLFISGLSGSVFYAMLLHYGAVSYLFCTLLAVTINTYNFPNLLTEKNYPRVFWVLMQISVVVGVIGYGVGALIIRGEVQSFYVVKDFVFAAITSQAICFCCAKICISFK